MYRIVGNFRGTKLLQNCKIQFSHFKIHDSLGNGFGKVIATCLNISRLYFHEAIITCEICECFAPRKFPAIWIPTLIKHCLIPSYKPMS